MVSETTADVLTAGIVFTGLWVASRPPDENHPYGHGRYETLAGLAVGAILLVTGAGICWQFHIDVGAGSGSNLRALSAVCGGNRQGHARHAKTAVRAPHLEYGVNSGRLARRHRFALDDRKRWSP